MPVVELRGAIPVGVWMGVCRRSSSARDPCFNRLRPIRCRSLTHSYFVSLETCALSGPVRILKLQRHRIPIVPLLFALRSPLVQRALKAPLEKARSKSSQVLDGLSHRRNQVTVPACKRPSHRRQALDGPCGLRRRAVSRNRCVDWCNDRICPRHATSRIAHLHLRRSCLCGAHSGCADQRGQSWSGHCRRRPRGDARRISLH